MRTIVFWGLYWGPLILGNYHIVVSMLCSFPSFSINRQQDMQQITVSSLSMTFRSWVFNGAIFHPKKYMLTT